MKTCVTASVNYKEIPDNFEVSLCKLMTLCGYVPADRCLYRIDNLYKERIGNKIGILKKHSGLFSYVKNAMLPYSAIGMIVVKDAHSIDVGVYGRDNIEDAKYLAIVIAERFNVKVDVMLVDENCRFEPSGF